MLVRDLLFSSPVIERSHAGSKFAGPGCPHQTAKTKSSGGRAVADLTDSTKKALVSCLLPSEFGVHAAFGASESYPGI